MDYPKIADLEIELAGGELVLVASTTAEAPAAAAAIDALLSKRGWILDVQVDADTIMIDPLFRSP